MTQKARENLNDKIRNLAFKIFPDNEFFEVKVDDFIDSERIHKKTFSRKDVQSVEKELKSVFVKIELINIKRSIWSENRKKNKPKRRLVWE